MSVIGVHISCFLEIGRYYFIQSTIVNCVKSLPYFLHSNKVIEKVHQLALDFTQLAIVDLMKQYLLSLNNSVLQKGQSGNCCKTLKNKNEVSKLQHQWLSGVSTLVLHTLLVVLVKVSILDQSPNLGKNCLKISRCHLFGSSVVRVMSEFESPMIQGKKKMLLIFHL